MTVATRIDRRFAAARRARRKLLIPFITAGFPTLTDTVPLMHELVAAGADLIELGVPFSDPMADGPTIQRANERALANGVTLAKTLAMVEAFRANDADTPVVLMGYANPFEAMGWLRFAAAAQRVGVDGVLTVDLPPEEAEMPVAHLTAAALAPIFCWPRPLRRSGWLPPSGWEMVFSTTFRLPVSPVLGIWMSPMLVIG